MYKLDLKDRKLLTLLDENARYSNTQLAKKVHLSKPAIEYRLSRFNKNKIIFAHYAVINITKLGYSQYKLYFKFQNTSLEDEQKILSYWIKNSNSVWVGQIRGPWDLAVSLLAKNNYEFGQALSKFMTKFSRFILQKDVLLTEYSPFYSRTYMAEAKQKEFLYGIPEQPYNLDKVDFKILKQLSNNAKIPILELAKKTSLSRDIVTYRLKKLQKENIITEFRTYLNLEKLNIRHYKIIFRMKNFSPEQENKIKAYVKAHKKATQLLKLIGSYDLGLNLK